MTEGLRPRLGKRIISLRKFVVFILNLASTFLTLFTGLRENPLVVLVTGRYDLIRSRFTDGTINYNMIDDSLLDRDHLMNLTTVGRDYRFFTEPTRGPKNWLSDRSLCTMVNSINASTLNIYFDDFWGTGARRTQTYLYSISASKCQVVNFQTKWVNSCVSTNGSAAACYQYIYAHFDELRLNKKILNMVQNDGGSRGIPFIKCRGRPNQSFDFYVDMMCLQSYWAGGSYHMEVLTSSCKAVPAMLSDDWQYGLFRVEANDQVCECKAAVDNTSWLASFISAVYAIVSIALIVSGLIAALIRSKNVYYVPNAVRYLKEQRLLRYLFPSMALARYFPARDNYVIRLKGSLFMASDVWMNNWLYIVFSILDAIINVRMTYVIFQLGTYMLSVSVNFESFIFMSSAVGRMTWLMCLVHTVSRLLFKLTIHSAKQLGFIKHAIATKLNWFVDGSAMFLSYKIYSIIMFTYLYIMLKTRKATSFQKRAVPSKKPVFGGMMKLNQFWQSEIVGDYLTIFLIMLAIGYTVSFFLLMTKYKYVVNNRAMRLLQNRYILVGWDALVAMEALGIDPLKPELIVDGVAATSCSLGCLLQQFYTSGPSGHVHLGGDFIFEEGGFSKEHVPYHMHVKQAQAIGILHKTEHGRTSKTGDSGSAPSKRYAVSSSANATMVESLSSNMLAKEVPGKSKNEDDPLEPIGEDGNVLQRSIKKETKSLFDRHLRIYSEGHFGRILLIDNDDSGRFEKNHETHLVELVVKDALAFTTIMDIKPLLGNSKKLHIT